MTTLISYVIWASYPHGLYALWGGLRVCLGNHFALLDRQLILATLAHQVRFEPLSTARVPLYPAVTLRPGGQIPAFIESNKIRSAGQPVARTSQHRGAFAGVRASSRSPSGQRTIYALTVSSNTSRTGGDDSRGANLATCS
jgi:hypothetical protein